MSNEDGPGTRTGPTVDKVMAFFSTPVAVDGLLAAGEVSCSGALSETATAADLFTLEVMESPLSTEANIERVEVYPGEFGEPSRLLVVWLRGENASAEIGDDLHERLRGLGADVVFRVQEKIQLDVGPATDRDCVRFLALRCPETITHDEFWMHWSDIHGPLVVEQGPGFHRYLTNRIITPPLFDGIAEQWFVDLEMWFRHDRDTLESKPLVRTDLATFVGATKQWRGQRTARWTRSR